ncbi:hypothetical protein JI435_437220 [Parastagonospora nodorum SN15]|uniref:Cyanovirin-N domain-containing protein n=1 Tax=Phaeosphaeria nodorum (strain SN15 / ATCC MYA-4574 / FGSC 10173) TaxID=321614 RepID=A0A7U2I2Q1_PHANO|nr:hypothetical protein HBH54_207320 [Parastagonospora nodorum]KAH4149442.1 hypothetical protein HBH44_194660 [Parastagonospora nodorum]KAH6288752.1 hypothetical protein HBI39_214810 [Parastagonospora nodorum]QRC99629.1 hypothetical protein JI435_437220 [Parastagonospora nodorum SN15]
MVFSNFILHQLALLAVIAPTTLGSSCTWARCECIDSGADAIVDTTYVDYTKCNGNVGTTSSSLSCITGGRPDGCSLWQLQNHSVTSEICSVGTSAATWKYSIRTSSRCWVIHSTRTTTATGETIWPTRLPAPLRALERDGVLILTQ